jgi:long-chain fatty acid transport protein
VRDVGTMGSFVLLIRHEFSLELVSYYQYYLTFRPETGSVKEPHFMIIPVQSTFKVALMTILCSLITGSMTVLSASGLESNGIGARGRAMGNAMVAAGDDWTAAFYNPAGLVWMDSNQSGFVYEYFTGGLESSASLRNMPLAAFPDPSRGDFIDPIGDEPATFNKKKIDAAVHYAEYGCAWDKGRTGYGLAIYGSGSGTAWEDLIVTGSGDPIKARIGFTNGSANIPLAAGVQVTERISLGGTLTLRYGLLEVDISKERTGSVPYSQKTFQDTEALALSVDVGALWRVSDRLNLGIVLRLPYRINKKGTTRLEDTLAGLSLRSDTTVREDYPLRMAAGAAWRPSARDLLGFSLTWMNWESYEQNISYDDPVPGILVNSSGNPAHWENTITIGMGYERRINERWSGRMGLLYDQAPEPEEYRTLIGGLVVDSWKLSAGAGLELGSARLNMGYSYTYGPEVDGYIDGASYGSRLHEVYAGLDWKL